MNIERNNQSRFFRSVSFLQNWPENIFHFCFNGRSEYEVSSKSFRPILVVDEKKDAASPYGVLTLFASKHKERVSLEGGKLLYIQDAAEKRTIIKQ
jgi:hypothetical protein